MFRLFFIVSGVCLLAGCSWFSNTDRYDKSQMVQPTIISPPLSSSKIDSYYPIPALSPKAPKGKPSLIPPGAKQ